MWNLISGKANSMYTLTPTRIIGRARDGSMQAAGYVYDSETDDETDVIITFDYTPAQPDRPNPDLPNPGPGSDSEVDVIQVTRDGAQNEQIDVSQCQFDPSDFIELADEYSHERSLSKVS